MALMNLFSIMSGGALSGRFMVRVIIFEIPCNDTRAGL